MSDQDAEKSDIGDSDVSKETKRLMEKAMNKELDTNSFEDDESLATQNTPTMTIIDTTFDNIKSRIENLILEIEDSAKTIEPHYNKRMESIIESLSNQLKTAGLGIFVNTAIRIIRNELTQEANITNFLSPIYTAIGDSKTRVNDIITKTHRGALRSLTLRTNDLQGRIVKLYAKINGLEQELTLAKNELSQWRSKSRELDEIIRRSEDSIAQQQNKGRLQQERIEILQEALSQSDEKITVLKGELGRAKAHIEQLQKIIEKLDKAEEIVSDYEDKILEISNLEGQLTEQQELLSQRDLTIGQLRKDVDEMHTSHIASERELESLKNVSSSAIGIRESLEEEISQLTEQLDELRARWDTLYRVAEDEPAFKAYFLVAGRNRTWLPLSHLSSALGIPIVALKKQLQKFLEVGLVEIEDDMIRPRKLSEVAKKSKAVEKEILEEAEKESGITVKDDGINESNSG